MRRRSARMLDEQVAAKERFFVAASGAATLTLDVDDAFVNVDSSAAAATVTLPSVSEAKGRIVDIDCPDGASNNVTIQDKNDDAALTDIVVAAAGYATLYSTGRKWRAIASKTS